MCRCLIDPEWQTKDCREFQYGEPDRFEYWQSPAEVEFASLLSTSRESTILSLQQWIDLNA